MSNPYFTALRGVCRDCGVPIYYGRHGYWRDYSPDPGDGDGGDASCPAREPAGGIMRRHRKKRSATK